MRAVPAGPGAYSLDAYVRRPSGSPVAGGRDRCQRRSSKGAASRTACADWRGVSCRVLVLTIEVGIPLERAAGIGRPDGPCCRLEELPHKEAPHEDGSQAQGPHGAGNRHVCGSEMELEPETETESRVGGRWMRSVAYLHGVAGVEPLRVIRVSSFVVRRVVRRLSCVVCRRVDRGSWVVGRVDGFGNRDATVSCASSGRGRARQLNRGYCASADVPCASADAGPKFQKGAPRDA